jgi:hypothetical protein
MGVQFLDMFPEEMDLRTNFVNYVKGKKAIVKVTGSLPPPPKKPRKQRTGKNDLLDGKYAKYNKGMLLLHWHYHTHRYFADVSHYKSGKKTDNLAELRPLIDGELSKSIAITFVSSKPLTDIILFTDKVSNGRWKVLSGWTGTHTISVLAKVGVKMKVKDNKLKIFPKDFCHQLDRLCNSELHRLLVAVGKGWFKLNPIESESVDVEDE